MSMKIILFYLIASLLVCNLESSVVLVKNDEEYGTAINSTKPTIVLLMSKVCTYSMDMKVYICICLNI
jgi:hypothetical protein